MSVMTKWSDHTGLEMLQSIMNGDFPFHDAMGETLNLQLKEIKKGLCVYEGTPQLEHLNPRQSVHGGWTMSILDAAAVLAVVSALPKGKLCATSTFEVKFVRPLSPDMLCRAEGELLSLGASLAHSKARLVEVKTDKLIAFCSASASVFDIDD